MLLAVDLTGQPVLVVGGGPIGQRKALSLAQAGAVVTVVDPRPAPEGWPATIGWTLATFQDPQLQGAALVVAAAPLCVNEAVVQAAKSRGIWVLDVSLPHAGTVRFPAVATLGALTLSVDTAGIAPGLAAALREYWLAELGPTFADWLEQLRLWREQLRQTIPDAEARQSIFRWLSSLNTFERYRAGALAEITAEFEELWQAARNDQSREKY